MDTGIVLQQTQGDEAALAIGETVVLESERQAREDSFCVDEIDVVYLQITSAFPRIPHEWHMQIVYTTVRVRNRHGAMPR